MNVVVSIPYTGTRFLKTRLRILRHVHTTCSWQQITSEVADYNIIAPLRDPKDCWDSATRRWRDLTTPFDVSRFIQGWMMMHAVTLWRQVDFIPVDLQHDKRITDWTPIGDTDPGKATRYEPAIDLKFIYELPFVKQYYHGPR